MPRSKPNAINKQIGARICRRRNDYGISMQQLATAIGVSWQQIQKYENGTSDVSISRLCAIAYQLQVPMDWFFTKAKQAKLET